MLKRGTISSPHLSEPMEEEDWFCWDRRRVRVREGMGKFTGSRLTSRTTVRRQAISRRSSYKWLQELGSKCYPLLLECGQVPHAQQHTPLDPSPPPPKLDARFLPFSSYNHTSKNQKHSNNKQSKWSRPVSRASSCCHRSSLHHYRRGYHPDWVTKRLSPRVGDLPHYLAHV